MKRMLVVCAVVLLVFILINVVLVIIKSTTQQSSLQQDNFETDVIPYILVDSEGNNYYQTYEGEKIYTEDPLPDPLTEDQRSYLTQAYGVEFPDTITDEVPVNTFLLSFEQIIQYLDIMENSEPSELTYGETEGYNSSTQQLELGTEVISIDPAANTTIKQAYITENIQGVGSLKLWCNYELYASGSFVGIEGVRESGWTLAATNKTYAHLEDSSTYASWEPVDDGTIRVSGHTTVVNDLPFTGGFSTREPYFGTFTYSPFIGYTNAYIIRE